MHCTKRGSDLSEEAIERRISSGSHFKNSMCGKSNEWKLSIIKWWCEGWKYNWKQPLKTLETSTLEMVPSYTLSILSEASTRYYFLSRRDLVSYWTAQERAKWKFSSERKNCEGKIISTENVLRPRRKDNERWCVRFPPESDRRKYAHEATGSGVRSCNPFGFAFFPYKFFLAFHRKTQHRIRRSNEVLFCPLPLDSSSAMFPYNKKSARCLRRFA